MGLPLKEAPSSVLLGTGDGPSHRIGYAVGPYWQGQGRAAGAPWLLSKDFWTSEVPICVVEI